MSGAEVPAGCAWLASKYGWTLRQGNVMVEGTSDVGYFLCASQLYFQSTGRQLVGSDLSIFAAGDGDEGGTYGISEKFPTLFNLAGLDLDAAGKRQYRVIALLDDDEKGRAAVAGIARGHRGIVEYDAIFRLRRAMPLRAGSARALGDKFKQANTDYGNLECAIEDLLPPSVCEAYVAENPSAQHGLPKIQGGGRHYSWTQDGKSGLLRFVKRHGILEDMSAYIAVLKALRSYLGLQEEGA